MKIDYFCFSVPNLDSTDYIIDNYDDENLVWVKEQEEKLMKKAKEENMLIIYDRETEKFYKNNEEVDINGKVIFPRCFINFENELLSKLEEVGAISIERIEDVKLIENWPEYIQPEYREVVEITYGDFLDNYKKYQEKFKSIFFKTVKKSKNRFVLDSINEFEYEGIKSIYTRPYIFNVNKDDKIMLSEEFYSIEDEINDTDCHEYRAFILDGELLNVSRSYVDYEVEVPTKIRRFIEEVIIKLNKNKNFPKNYVLDVGEMIINDKEVIDIIEFNPIVSSGLEVSNDLINDYKERIKLNR